MKSLVIVACRLPVILYPPHKTIRGMNKSIPRMESTGIEYPPLKLKLDLKHKMLMLNICGANLYFQDTPADLRHISLIFISLFSRPQIEKNWF